MGYGVVGLLNNRLNRVVMGWQDWVVAVIGIVAVAVVVRRAWRLFVCGDSSACAECAKDCKLRKRDR